MPDNFGNLAVETIELILSQRASEYSLISGKLVC